MKILSFGSLNIDYNYKLDHIVAPGETISSHELIVTCGGKGLNQSVALRKAGANVLHAGIIGYDGEMLKKSLEDAGVCTDLLKVDPEHKSGHTIIQIEEGTAQNCIIVCPGTNGMVDKDYIEEVVSHFEAGDYAVFQNEITNVDYAMKCCKEKGLRVVFNPSPMTRELAESDIYQYVDDLFINEVEGEQMTGKNDPEQICLDLKARWPQCRTILTLGSEGAMILTEEGFLRQKAFPCEAVDTTGAGDTFSGFFTALSASGKEPKEAMELSCKASSLAVRKMGAAASIPTLEEVLAADF
ncbi:MAG: ribokinase [Parasporobacterium sp.]|nr:ribokinase [Parasporobacterium sp.]